jgi:hypothetical protein
VQKMSNVLLTWVLPPVSLRQRAILHTKIEFRAVGVVEWTLQDTVSPDVAQELRFVDVPPGDWEYRGTVVDVDGVWGAPATASVAVPFDAPGVITSFTATLE